VPYIYSQGLRGIDTLIISHADNDHRGGAESVLRAFAPARVLSSAPELPFPNEACVRGMRWTWDGVGMEILHPTSSEHGRHNNNSCVLLVRSAYGAVLLPGDIEKRAEQSLLMLDRERIAAEVLVAPHHGSRTSSHDDFVRAIKPEHVLFPVGYRNRYRHPHPAVVERYRDAGAALYDSPARGALEFRIDALGIHASAYRDTDRRYWFSQ
jgi:competence protein ComEC